jgi:Zn finger protein HypA/HybF involved in hydrogenase expression
MTRTVASELTVGDLLARGIEDVEALCVGCGSLWRSPITVLPPATSLTKTAALMICPTCGGRDIEVDPTLNTGRVQ